MTLNLEKLDRFVHLRGTGLDELEWKGSDDEEGGSSDSEGDEPDDESDDDDDEGVDDELEALEEGEEDEEARERRFAALSQAEKVSRNFTPHCPLVYSETPPD